MVVGRRPIAVTTRQIGLGVPCKAVIHCTCLGIEQIAALLVVQGARLFIIALVAQAHSNITGGHLGRTIDARVGAVLASTLLGPTQHVPLEVGALPDAIKGSLGIVDIYFLASQLIGTSSGNNHPHHVVVKVVTIPFIGIFIHQMQPVGAHLFLEVIVYRGKSIEILLLARGFVGVEHGLKNLGFAPSALGKGLATTHGLKERGEVALAHLIAQSVGKGGDRGFFYKGPGLLSSIVARLLGSQ